MTLTGMAVLHVRTFFSAMMFAIVAMAAHFKGLVARPRSTSVALQVRENLNLPPDDALEDVRTLPDALDEHAGRWNELRERAHRGEQIDRSELETALRPIQHFLSTMRGASEGDDAVESPRERRARLADRHDGAELDEADMSQHRRCVLPGMSGLVVDHAAKRR